MKRRKSHGKAPRNKTRDISEAASHGSTRTIESLGVSDGGFLNREWRRVFWRKLLIDKPVLEHAEDWRIEKRESGHFDPEVMKQISVIDADVVRCVSHWDIHEGLDPGKRSQLRDDLRAILVALVYTHREAGFKYYQGLHEVGLVFLNVGNPTQAFYMVEALALNHLANFVHLPFNLSLLPLTDAVMYLIGLADSELHAKFLRTGTPAHFCIPWLLTWFAHCFSASSLIQRVFDFLLCSPPALSVHLCAALVIHARAELLALPDDMPTLHAAAQALPREVGAEALEAILVRATRLEKSVCSVAALGQKFPACMQQPGLLKGKSLGRAAATVVVAVALGAVVAVSAPTALLTSLFREA